MLSLLDMQRELEKVKSELKATRNALDMAARRLSIIEGMQSTNDVTKDTGSDVGVAGDEVYKCLDIPVYWGKDENGAIKFGRIQLEWDGDKWVGSANFTGILQSTESKYNTAAIEQNVSLDPPVDETVVRQGPKPGAGVNILAYLANVILVEPCPNSYYAVFNSLAKWFDPTASKYGSMTFYFDDTERKAYPVAVWL